MRMQGCLCKSVQALLVYGKNMAKTKQQTINAHEQICIKLTAPVQLLAFIGSAFIYANKFYDSHLMLVFVSSMIYDLATMCAMSLDLLFGMGKSEWASEWNCVWIFIAWTLFWILFKYLDANKQRLFQNGLRNVYASIFDFNGIHEKT